jgi:hypothetical protein
VHARDARLRLASIEASLREDFGAHAYLHFGTHGALEFMPGKQAGLCFTVPECNSLGLAMLEPRPLGEAFDRAALAAPGDGWIEVPKSVSLDPTASAWTVEVACKPEKPDGMILARGGRAQGYALWWKQGHPAFTIVIGSKPITIEAKEMVTDWVTVMGTITSDGKATLHVDGRLVADAALPGLIERNPNDAMQVGADLGSPVVEPAPPKFTGWIERVRLFSGEYKPEKP